MGPSARHLLSTAALMTGLMLAGCQPESSSGSSVTESAEKSQAVEQSLPPATKESAIVPDTPDKPAFDLTVADIDAYAKGLQKENELAREAILLKKAAQNDEQRLNIMMNAIPQALKLQAGAASGIDRARYFAIRDAIGHILSGIETKSIMINQAQPVDTEDMSADQAKVVLENTALVEKAYGDPFRGVAVEVAEVIQRRHVELKQLLDENLQLVMTVAQD